MENLIQFTTSQGLDFFGKGGEKEEREEKKRGGKTQ
jgi:hypothetical protein